MVGALMTGLIGGTLLSRNVSGAVAQTAGSCSASYVAAAMVTARCSSWRRRSYRLPNTARTGSATAHCWPRCPPGCSDGREASMGIYIFAFAALAAV